MNRLDIAIDAARAAGEVLLRHFGGELDVQTKSSEIDLVTVADRKAEVAILERFEEHTPDYAVLAEESGARAGQAGAPRWVVDPLDGTTNYANGYPHYSVSIGLVEDEVPVLGVVHDPSRGEMFVAERGAGAWLLRGESRTKLTVTGASRLSEALQAAPVPNMADVPPDALDELAAAASEAATRMGELQATAEPLVRQLTEVTDKMNGVCSTLSAKVARAAATRRRRRGRSGARRAHRRRNRTARRQL